MNELLYLKMSNKVQPETKKPELQAPEEHIDEEEEDDNTPVDPDVLKKLNNLTIDQSAFTGTNEPKSKKKKGKQPKDNKGHGKDFLEYAGKNGIELNIKYEKSPEKTNTRNNIDRKEGYKNNYSNNNNSNNYKQGGQKYQTQNKKFMNNNKFNNNHTHNKKEYNENYGQQQKTFSNKFDPVNGYNMHPYMYPMQQPFGNMMRPDMMYFGQMPMQPMQPMHFPNVMQTNDELPHNFGEKGIKESLEYYLSLENLNKDFYIRTKIDSNGYIDVNDILNFNNMKKNKASLESIREIVKEGNTIIEEAIFSDKVFVRNKKWEEIKPYLCSIEELESKKTQKKGNYNYNYVTMQNNYYMPMMQFDPMMMQGGMPMTQFGGMPNMMGMGNYNPNSQLDK